MTDEFSLLEDILNEASEDFHFLPQTLSVMDGIPGGFFIYRADGDQEILYANQALFQLTGCANEEEFRALTGGTFRGLVHPDDLGAVEESIQQQISQDDLDYVVYRIHRKDGRIRWLEDYGHLVKNEKQGDVFYVFVTDATQKMQQREKERAALLQENNQKEARIRAYDRELHTLSEEHLRRMDVIAGLSVDYESIFYVDLDTDLVQAYRAGPAVSSMFSQGHRDYSGFTAEYTARCVHPEDRAMVARQLEPETIRNRLAGSKVAYTNFRCQDGPQVEYLQLRIVNIGGETQVSQILLATRSVDDEIRRALEQQEFLSDALQQARTAVAAKNAFLSNMSHDMRTPLNAIAGFTMLARRHADSREKVMRYLDMIEVSGNQLLRLITNVLEIARIESGGEHLEQGDCDLREIAERVRSALFARAASKNLTLSLHLGGLRQPMVYGDGRKLEEILYHLASNAVKYTEPGGRVDITMTEQDGAAPGFGSYQMIVTDDGIGISKGFLDHIFESFSREQNTTISGVYGTGLGLPIVKSIVEMMDGTMEVKSMPRRGSQFTVTLPLRLQSAGQPEPVLSPAGDGGRKILIVEDNELNLEIAQELLQDAGFEVDSAENGKIGYERVRDSQPGEYALVLMDIQMPVMDGYQATQAIRELPQPALAQVPIVALSANAFEEDKRKAFDSGMNAHMAKPLEIDQLLDLIQQLTGIDTASETAG